MTNEIKKREKKGRIKMKTTIEEENYLKCKKVLKECSGEYKCIFLCNVM